NACTSPTTYTGLADGSHSFTLRGADAAGNTATKSYVWNVDTVAPVVSISGPRGYVTSKSASFTFSSTEGTPVCSEDFGGNFSCSSPYTWSTIADGGHTFAVSATDAAGNIGVNTWTITADSTAPSVTLAAV